MNSISKNTFKYILNIINILSIFLFFSCAGYAEESSRIWTSIGPEGGHIGRIVFSPSHPDIVYATVNVNSDTYFIKSENGGESWEIITTKEVYLEYDGTTRIEDLEFDVEYLVVDSVNPDALYAVSTFSLLKSTDGGHHWVSIDPYLNIDSNFYVDTDSFALLNKTANSQLLKVIAYGYEQDKDYIAVSNDGGESWVVSEDPIGLADNKPVSIHAVAESNPDIMYGTNFIESYDGSMVLHKSVDGGKSWFRVANLPDIGIHLELMIHPKDSEKLFWFVSPDRFSDNDRNRAVLYSVNGGKSWETFSKLENDLTIGQLFFDPVDTNILYAYFYQYGDDIYNSTPVNIQVTKSIDFGKNWQVIDTEKPENSSDYFYFNPFSKMTVNPVSNNKILRSTPSGVLSSHNGGLDWHSSNTGLRLLSSSNFSVAHDNSSVMYLVMSGRFYKSSNGGEKWEVVESEETIGDSCVQIIINPKDNNNILCITDNSLYESKDAGAHWLLLREDVNLVAYTNDGKAIYAYDAFRNKLLKNVEGSDQWMDISIYPDRSPAIVKLLVDPTDSNTIYSLANENGDNASVYKSIDGGLNWIKKVSVGQELGEDLIIHPSYPDRLAFLYESGGALSNDGGNTWIFNHSLFANNFFNLASISFNPRNYDGAYWASSAGVIETKDIGNTWENIQLKGEINNFNSHKKLHVFSDNVYVSTDKTIYKLSTAVPSSETTGCLFRWAERQYPSLFSPVSSRSEEIEDYTYRHYSHANTYLGIYQDTKIHLLQLDVSNEIQDIGYLENYLNLSECYF